MRTIAVALVATIFASHAMADEKPVQLKKADGLDKVEGNCASCHSLDYVLMNSPFPNATVWDATVTKMIKAFGAPIDENHRRVSEKELRQLTLGPILYAAAVVSPIVGSDGKRHSGA